MSLTNGAVQRSSILEPLVAHSLVVHFRSQNTEEEFTKAFRAIDHNKDGSIDIGELKRLMVVMGFGLMDTELKEIFGLVDTDGKRKVDLDEFVDYMMNA